MSCRAPGLAGETRKGNSLKLQQQWVKSDSMKELLNNIKCLHSPY